MKEDPNYNVLIIKEVEKHPVLYNPGVTGYNNRDLQDQAWGDIAEAVCESANSCKERWKHLRSSLCRHLRNLQSGPIKRPYYLIKHMEFLIPFTKTRSSLDLEDNRKIYHKLITKTETPDISEDSSFSDAYPMVTYNEDMLQQQMEPVDNDNLSSFEAKYEERDNSSEFYSNDCGDPSSSEKDTSIHPKQSSKRPRTNSPIKELDQISSSSLALETVLSDHNDPDLNFLKSLLPDMKRMSDREKNDFKIRTLQSIVEFLYKS